MSDELKQHAWVACDAVNRMVLCNAPLAEIHEAIGRVRKFLESRTAQTAPLPEESADNFSDLLGV